jgi:GNAT superfamily N-acetyltransferase
VPGRSADRIRDRRAASLAASPPPEPRRAGGDRDRPRWRARGIGGFLLERAERVARSWEAPEVRLHTACDNAGAQRFFARAGYRAVEGVPSYYPNGQEALEMVRSLV